MSILCASPFDPVQRPRVAAVRQKVGGRRGSRCNGGSARRGPPRRDLRFRSPVSGPAGVSVRPERRETRAPGERRPYGWTCGDLSSGMRAPARTCVVRP